MGFRKTTSIWRTDLPDILRSVLPFFRNCLNHANLAVMLVVLISILFSLPIYALDAEEFQVKAAYLYQFTRFVEWPRSSFNSPDADFELCLMGVNRFGVSLSLLSQRSYEDHPIVLRFLNSVDQARECHLLYIATSEADHEADLLENVGEVPVLTVSSLPGFVEQGGVIGFVRSDHHIRFNINRKACKRQGLDCSAKLLEAAAKIVNIGNKDGPP